MVKVTVEHDGDVMYSQECRLAVVSLQGLKDEPDANLLNVVGQGPSRVLSYMKLVNHIVRAIVDEIEDPELQALALHGLLEAVERGIRESIQAADVTDEDAPHVIDSTPLYHS